MNETVNKIYNDAEVVLDHHKYVECTFENCLLVYYGDGPTSTDECQFKNCQFDFRGGASSTFNTLRSFFYGGLEEVVANVLASIVATDEEASPLEIQERDGQSHLVLDLGQVDPNDYSANGHQES